MKRKSPLFVLATYAVVAATFADNEGDKDKGDKGSGNPKDDASDKGSGNPGASDESKDKENDDDKSDDDKRDYKAEAKANAREAQKLRAERADLQKKLQEFEDRDKTELEREKSQRERAEAELAKAKAEAFEAKIVVAAAKKGFADPQDAVALVAKDVEGDEGKIADALDSLLKAKPYLKGAANGVPGTPGGNPEQKKSDAARREEAVVNAVPFLKRRQAEADRASGKTG